MPPSLVARAVEWIRAADESLDDGANISSPVLGRSPTAALLRDLEAAMAEPVAPVETEAARCVCGAEAFVQTWISNGGWKVWCVKCSWSAPSKENREAAVLTWNAVMTKALAPGEGRG